MWLEDIVCPAPDGHEVEEEGYCVNCGLTPYKPPFDLPPHMSPSQVNSLLTCGEQYRLERVERVPSRPMWAGVGGTTVHKVTEELDREWYLEEAAKDAAMTDGDA